MHGPACIFWANLTPFSLQLAADKAEAEPESEPEAGGEAEAVPDDEDDDEIQALQEEIQNLQEMDEPEDDGEQEERDEEIADMRAAIEERRAILAQEREERAAPRAPVRRRKTEVRPSDIRVGTKVMALRDMAPVIQFEQGEVSAVSANPEDEASPHEIVVQWFSCGEMSTIDATQVNVLYTAFQMRERLAQCLRIGRDNSLPADDQQEQMAATLAGKLVLPPLAVVTNDGADAVDEDIVLTQQQVADVLLPKVKQDWSALYTKVRDQTITTPDLNTRFGPLESAKRCAAELRLLAATGDGQVSTAAGPPAWVADVLGKLEDFLLSERLQKWIPAILAVREITADLFQVKEEDDTSVAKVRSFFETVQRAWHEQVLGTLSELVEPVKDLFQRFSSAQLDFLASLAKNESLIKWLLEHDDTDAFNSLLQVCRPRTEDPLLLKAIASLVQVRTVMLDLLYLSPPYTVFGQMLDVVLKVDMARGATLQHPVTARHGAAKVYMQPASAGTGISAGGPMRAVFEVVGVHDVLAK